MRSAEELHQAGVEAINAGRLAQARRLLTTALERAESDELRAKAESSLAYCAAESGDRWAGLELCATALQRTGLTRNTRGSIHGQRGLLLMLEGRTTESLAEFDIAIETLEDAPDYLGRALLNRGGVYLQQERVELAEGDFDQAAVQLHAADLPVEEAMARHNLGYCRLLRGDLVAALRDMDAAKPVLAPLSAVSEATCESDRAAVLLAAGLVSQGRDALRQAAAIYGRRRLPQRRGEAELTLARSLLMNEPETALETARSARRIFSRGDRAAWRVRAEAAAIAAEVELGRAAPSLVTRADEVATALDTQGLTFNAALTRLHAARVLARRGDVDEASRRLGPDLDDTDVPLMVRLVDRTARVELARTQGSSAEALGHVRRGLSDLHAWQSTFGSLDLQTSVVGRGQRLALSGLELAVLDGSPPVLFEWSERARMLASRVSPVRPPVDEALAEALAELRQLQTTDDGLSVSDLARAEALRRQVRERALLVQGSGEVADPATLPAVQEALGADQALVAYVAAAGRVVALVVTDADATVRDLGSGDALRAVLGGLHADLDMAGSDLPDAFAAPVRRQLAARLAQLDAVLVAPVADLLGARRLVLTPSGVLAGVPWGLLPGMHGRPVTVTRSATSWLSRQTTPLRLASAGFVAGPRVPRAAAEVTAAAQAWPGAELLTGEAATAAAVSDLAARVDVLHVSAHGRHSAENPLFSGVELVGGPWFGYDIDQLAEIPDVVLLSACEVGRSEVRFGEELVGMTTAWLHAGARCVIASAAAVNDVVAHDVLVSVHRSLGAGEDPATALAAACPPASEDAAPAPFVCFC